jgi:GNAT superfamily N-acetyltransferase
MTVTVEPMTGDDVEPAARLRMAAFFSGSDRTLEQDMAGLRELVAEAGGFQVSLVARIGDELAGSVLLVRDELDARHDVCPWLAGLVVAPQARQRGIGSALVKAIETHAGAHGIERLYLYTWEARRFYALLGWLAVETFDDGGEPAMMMSRRLL